MNRNDCDIARDLMPLAIDGVCSEGSQHFLDSHLTQCPPCQSMYERMKNVPSPVIEPAPGQEEQALHRSLRRLSKRLRWLWIALAALAGAFVLLLAAAGIQQMRWYWTSTAPVESYNLQLVRDGIAAKLLISADFPTSTYNGSGCDVQHIGDSPENLTGAPEAVILTYSVSYFPYQAKDHLQTMPFTQPFRVTPQDFVDTEYRNPAMLLDSFMYQGALHNQRLCVEDGNLYLVGSTTAVHTTTGKTMLLVTPGLPVSEIRATDSKTTYTVYTWGRSIPQITEDRFDEYGLPKSGILDPSDLEKYADLIIQK